MSELDRIVADDRVDDHVNDEIIDCLTAVPPKSFFLFAGAGSGKTRALVTALNGLRARVGNDLRLRGQHVAVITYTNAAADEIIRRLDFDPLIVVATIHSFVWTLIGGFNKDIRKWLEGNLRVEIAELQQLQRKGRPGSQAAADRESAIASKQERLASLSTIKRFIYSPTGDNRTRDSLNHAEVIKIGASFLSGKPLMQELLISRHPMLLIDESQDTNKLLMDALFAVEAAHRGQFTLGLFGDTMQRIYSDGKVDLGKNLPAEWSKPAMVMNHRCPRRVIRLINKIRAAVDDHEQQPRTDAVEGQTCLFISGIDARDRQNVEREIRNKMADITRDELWNQSEQVKTLTLEHHMSARRMGFLQIFEPLYGTEEYQTGLLDGSLPMMRLFSELVLPLITAHRSGNKFSTAAILRKESPLLSKRMLESNQGRQGEQIKRAKVGVEALANLWKASPEPRCIDVLQCVAKHGMFDIPDGLRPFAADDDESVADDVESDVTVETENGNKRLEAVRRFLAAPFSEIGHYAAYVQGKSSFGTHQGVKGLEFPRVCVVMDDDEARGFLFSYEKLFGAKEKTTTDLKHEAAGEETGIDRTRRLFYVTCSRSRSSLALVAYSSDPQKIRSFAIQQGWFEDDEIYVIP